MGCKVEIIELNIEAAIRDGYITKPICFLKGKEMYNYIKDRPHNNKSLSIYASQKLYNRIYPLLNLSSANILINNYSRQMLHDGRRSTKQGQQKILICKCVHRFISDTCPIHVITTE